MLRLGHIFSSRSLCGCRRTTVRLASAHGCGLIRENRSGGEGKMTVLQPGKVYLGTSEKPEYVSLPFANRHGLITGATGTGKTVTLQILAEGFSAAGVPVFCADIKGDLAGLAVAGEPKDFLAERAEKIGFTSEYDLRAVAGGLLGPVRQGRSSDPHHDLGDGAAAAVPSAGSERHPGRRAQHRLPHGRRRGASGPRPQGPPGAAGSCRRATPTS